ncbi:MAG: hypothetical protein JXR69_06305 [Candidatus Delongbacteria bacterium]|nr:hypothetical protein [Candidatus Delongbacteria bacterium]
MKEKIKIKCSHCDEEIGEISFSPEKKYVGCGYCGKRTVVKIRKDGTVESKLFEEKHISHKPYENIVKKTIMG